MSADRRAGFTLLEAVVTVAIVGMVSVASLSAIGAEQRVAQRAATAVTAAALAQDRLARLELLTAEELNRLPDSLTTGRFPSPFTSYSWSAAAEPLLGNAHVYDLSVSVRGEASGYELVTRLYRPARSRDDS